MKKNKLLILSILCFLFVSLTGCEDKAPPTTTEYTVTFDAGTGGTLTGSATVKVKSGEKVAEPTDPTRPDYTFVNWQKADGTAFDFDTETITANITLTAQWGFTVTFAGEGVTTSPQIVPDSGMASQPPTPTRPDYTFVEWQDDNGSPFSFNTAITADITLTAQWGFTVTFAGEDVTKQTQTVPDGGMATRPATDPTREGFAFLGWQDADSKIFDFNTAISANITLTAGWKSPGAVSNVVIELDTTALTTKYQVASYVYTDGDGTVVSSSTAEVKWLVSDNSDGTSATEVSTEATYSPVGMNRYKFVSASVRVKSAENVYTPEEKSTTSLFAGFSTKATGSTDKFTASRDAGAVNFNGKMWVIGGFGENSYLNEVWSSSDGATWARETRSASFGFRNKHTVLSFNDTIWVIGGYGNDLTVLDDVWSSTDGVTWKQVAEHAGFPARENHTSVVHNNKMWVIGGNGSSDVGQLADVWSSSDGVTWVQSTISSGSGFPARQDHTSVVHDGKMWVIGGQRSNSNNLLTSLADVWSSSDGATWTQSTIPSGSGFSKRSAHTSVAYDGKMWIIGGTNDNGFTSLADVWSSSNGTTWTQSTIPSDSGFPARYGHTSVVFDKKIFVLGGKGSSLFNDVWY